MAVGGEPASREGGGVYRGRGPQRPVLCAVARMGLKREGIGACMLGPHIAPTGSAYLQEATVGSAPPSTQRYLSYDPLKDPLGLFQRPPLPPPPQQALRPAHTRHPHRRQPDWSTPTCRKPKLGQRRPRLKANELRPKRDPHVAPTGSTPTCRKPQSGRRPLRSRGTPTTCRRRRTPAAAAGRP